MTTQQTPLQTIDYRIEVIGVDHTHYFPGRSATHTPYDEVFIGVGPNAADAYEAAADNISEWSGLVSGDDVSMIPDRLPTGNYPAPFSGDDPECDMNYYVAIYFKRPADHATTPDQ